VKLSEIKAKTPKTIKSEKSSDEAQRVKIILNSIPAVCTFWDEGRNLVFCNQSAANLFGLDSPQDYLDRFGELSPPHQPCGTPSLEKAMQYVEAAFETGYSKFNWMHQKPDGTPIPSEITLERVDWFGSHGLVGFTIDMREVNNALKMEQEASEMVSSLLEAAPMFVEIRDDQLNLIDCNGQVVNLFGAESKAKFIEENHKYYPKYQPCGTPSKELETTWLKKVMQNGYAKFEFMHLTADGEDLPLEFTYVRLQHGTKITIVGYGYDLRQIKHIEQQRLEIVEESNKAKSRFLARMSHEIRTPISAVMGLSEVQLRGQTMPPQIEAVFNKIYASAKTLLHIVNDVLDFSKIESGKMSLVNSTYDIVSLVSDAAQLHLIYVENKNIEFQLNVDENMPAYLEGDVLRIRQIITNLLTNAFKYTESGSVSLSLQFEQAHEGHVLLIISVHDTGIGMTSAQIKKIQDTNNEYVRLHEQEKPFVSGTGLGFPIVYSLVKMMNAHIDLKSDPSKGTHVVVSIPQKVIGNEIVGKALAASLQNFETDTLSSIKELEFKPEPMPYGKVLVVDDIEVNRHVAEAMLEIYDLEIELCESGREAIEKIKQGQVFDIIFMDYMMPEMDGIQATKIIREMGYAYPIVALTANAIKGQEELLMNNGFSGFMSKPIDLNQLNAYLVRFIQRK